MKKYGLIGYPLGHSMSPVIHKELFLSNKVDASYSLIEISEDDLHNNFDDLKKYDGFNVTIPHKINVIEHLDELSPKAELFGAVNTVANDNGKLVGYNTDCYGFLRALELADIKLGGDVLVLGSGGVSRMFAFESVLNGANVTVAVRKGSLNKAEKLRQEIRLKLDKDIDISPIDDTRFCWDLIINGTPVGMYPNIDASPISKGIIRHSAQVFDAVYNPQETLLLKYAKEFNLKFSNGLAMLVLQAAVAQEKWYGAKFTDDDIKRVIKITQEELGK